MNRRTQLAALGLIVAAAVIVPSHMAAAHNASLACQADGRIKFTADSYGAGSWSVNGGSPHTFSGGFTVFLPGDTAVRGVIVAPDWPRFDQTAGPCVQPTTTTVRATTTTAAAATTTSARSTTSTSTTTAPSSPSTTAPSTSSTPTTTRETPTSTSTTPPTSAPSSASSAPSLSVAPGSTGSPPPSWTSSPPRNEPTPAPSAPVVATLPVTGTRNSGGIALIAAGMFAAGALLVLAVRRKVRS